MNVSMNFGFDIRFQLQNKNKIPTTGNPNTQIINAGSPNPKAQLKCDPSQHFSIKSLVNQLSLSNLVQLKILMI